MRLRTADEARSFFHAKFCDSSASTHIPATLVGKAEEIVPGVVFQFRVDHETYHDCTARMYCGLGDEMGGRLWLQEAQSLVRFSGKQHDALPRVLDGVFRDEDGVGVVISERRGDVMTAEDTADFRADPALAFRCFILAADAVRTLHSHGLIHRDIWRGSFEVIEPLDDEAPLSIRLFGFEMSAFVASLIDPVWRAPESDGELLKGYLARGGPGRHLFRAPEMLGDDGFGTAHLSYRSDIFCLGMCGYEWFIDELPQELVCVSPRAPLEPSEVLNILEKRIIESRRVPEPLRDLLREMLRADPRIRPTASDVVNALIGLQDDIARTWRTESNDRPHLVAVSPEHVEQFVQIETFRDLSTDPDMRFAELRVLIEKDLDGALLIHEPVGARGYVQGGDFDAQAESVWALIGRQAVYFCQEYHRRRRHGHTTVPWALQIKYVVDRRDDDVSKIGTAPLRRRVRAVKVVHSTQSTDLDPSLGQRDHPSWQPLLAQVRRPDTVPWSASFIKGFKWWLSVQAATLQIRQYAYRRAPDQRTANSRIVRLVWDAERDQRWIESRMLRHLIASLGHKRPAFGNFFETLPDRDLGEHVTWRANEGGVPARTKERNRGRVIKRIDANTIEVDVREGAPPPAVGWLSPAEDILSDILLRRETSSAAALFAKPILMEALYSPRSFSGPRTIWKKAGGGLGGRAPEIVKDMLATFPFYALQGPPGTGKTTVVANALKAYLQAKPGARILVAAQSHYALDELADRLMHLINDNDGDADAEPSESKTRDNEIVAVRVAGEQSLRQVRESIRKEYLDDVQASQRLKAIKDGRSVRRGNGGRETAAPMSQEVLAIRGEWQKIAESSLYEIQDHIWRGANIIFATCGTCTDELLGVHDEFDAFDWVIVEEAAKAWPVELAMPLVLGHRWTLIGDHRQLPPYGELEIKDIFAACKESPRPEVRSQIEESPPFIATLDLFKHLFTEENDGTSGARRRPIDRLDMQFRMNDAILRVVRRAFYPKVKLESADELKDGAVRHEIVRPAALRYRALVWLDTGRVDDCRREFPQWENPGEAEVIRLLVNNIRPSLRQAIQKNPAALALLSPYQQQNQLLRNALPADFTDFIHTTDSFQGQEADIVIVSLVRTNDAPTTESLKRIGHVGSPQRANVLLSRARKLLVIVGDFDHFRDTADTVWPTVCATVSELQAREILPPDLGSLR